MKVELIGSLASWRTRHNRIPNVIHDCLISLTCIQAIKLCCHLRCGLQAQGNFLIHSDINILGFACHRVILSRTEITEQRNTGNQSSKNQPPPTSSATTSPRSVLPTIHVTSNLLRLKTYDMGFSDVKQI